MLSLIPWRRIFQLATPFLKEIFLGKFNLVGYFLNHKVITVLLFTLLFNHIAFQYVSHGTDAIYDKAVDLNKQNKELLIEVGKLKTQVATLGHAANIDTPRSSKVSEAEVSKGLTHSTEDTLYKEALYEIIRLKQEDRNKETSTQDNSQVKGEVKNELSTK